VKRTAQLGVALCALAAVLWAVSATVARKLIDDGGSALELSEARAVAAAAAFWLITARVRQPSAAARTPSSSGVGSARVAVTLLGIAVAAVNLSYFLAIERLPVAIAVVIQYTAPALVVVYDLVVEHRRPSARTVVALAGVLIGVALISDAAGALRGSGALDPAGVAFAAVSAVGFAAYNVLAARAEPAYGSIGAHARGFTIASVIWLVVQAPRGAPSTLLEPNAWPGIAVVTLVGTVAAFGIYSAGIRRIGAAHATITSTVEPVAVAVLAALVLDQTLTAPQIVGAVLVLASVVTLHPREVVVPPPGPAAHGVG
jgi:drug/metabolite transporter (DMT)-like permease